MGIFELLLLALPCGFTMLVVAFALGFLVLYSRHKAQAQNQTWKALADELGLTYSPGNWAREGSMEGVYKGHAVKLMVFTRGSGEGRSTWTRVQTGLGLGLGLKVYREHALSAVGEMLGLQDIQTGDSIFDWGFVVKGRDEAKVLQFLTPSVRQAILAYDKICPVGVTDEHIAWEVGGVIHDLDRLRSVVHAQRALADELCRQDAHNAAGVEDEVDMFASVGAQGREV